ncbi:MAG: ABC transporter substrate-binding protein [Ruminococcaceae bacterium]|nr:ABC transporter substrate-binding protein [Oscillospiraceae bacterium]
MKKILALLLCLVMCVCAFAGCGENTDSDKPTVLTLGLEQDIDNFDPFTNQQNPFVRIINFNCYETLFHYNEDMELVMDLATEYKKVDDTTYTFKLREGVKFHNGEAFTADDVIYTINTIKDEATGAWRNSQYANVAEMKAIDSLNLEIKLAAPQAGFIDNLAYTAIVSKSTTPKDLTTKPVGTGAFKFVSWTPNDSIKFEKFDEYWEADKVNAEELIMKVIPDATVAVTSLQSGTVQFLGSVDIESANTIANDNNLVLLESKYASTVYEVEIGRHNNPALADKDVVKAMFLALDRETVAKNVFSGKASASKSPFPSAAKYFAEVDTDGYDLEEAKKVLAGTKYKDGFSFEVYVLNSDMASQQTMIIWQDALKELGIEMKINICEVSVWLDAYLNRSYDMIANYYSMVGTDPSTYCSVIMTALADYQTKDLPDLNKLILDSANGSDEKVREDGYKTIQEQIVEYRPVASYVECTNLNGTSKDLSDITVNAMGHAFLKYASFK